MKFFPGLFKVLAAVLAPVATLVVQNLIAYFQSAAPSDVGSGLWVIISAAAVLVLNFVLGKIPAPKV